MKDVLLATRVSEEAREGIAKLAEYEGKLPAATMRDLITYALVEKIVSAQGKAESAIALHDNVVGMLENGYWKKGLISEYTLKKYPNTFEGYYQWKTDLETMASEAGRDFVNYWNCLHAFRPIESEKVNVGDLVKRALGLGNKKVVVNEKASR
jgi:hypothetical protein